MNAIKILFTFALAATLPAHGADRPSESFSVNFTKISFFQGSDRNWFNPANWSTGRVPGENDVVVLDGTDDVVIDSALAVGAHTAQARSITMYQKSRLTLTGAGVRFRASLGVLEDQALLETHGAVIEMDDFVSNQSRCKYPLCGFSWNPSTFTVTRSGDIGGSMMYFGLGGREPAAVQKAGVGRLVLTGYGHYATMRAPTVLLGRGDGAVAAATTQFHRLFGDADGDGAVQMRQISVIQDLFSDAVTRAIRHRSFSIVDRTQALPRLRVGLHYGFRPAAGDTFQIITADTMAGAFEGLPEGELIGCTEDNVGLTISYRGGDGNDVVLSAQDTDPRSCEAAAVKHYRVVAVDDAGG